MSRLPFVVRAGAASAHRTLADHLSPGAPEPLPGPLGYVARVGAPSRRTLADHLRPPAPPPAPPAPTPPTQPAPAPAASRPAARPAPRPAPDSAPPRTARVGEARASERRIVLDDDARVVTLTTDDLPRRGRCARRCAGSGWSPRPACCARRTCTWGACGRPPTGTRAR
nr:hypothetical protein [Angustibacter aerolatus]